LAAGCYYPLQRAVDNTVCDLAAHPRDFTPPQPVSSEQIVRLSSASSTPGQDGEPNPPIVHLTSPKDATQPDSGIRPVVFQSKAVGKETIPTQPKSEPPAPQPRPSGKTFEERLRMPPELPGAGRRATFPPRNATPSERQATFRKLFPPLPALEPSPVAAPGQYGHPLTLAELQQLAIANSPLLRQAAADVEAARGAAKQAGAYPNPNFGYEADNVGSANSAGFQGFFIEQIIKTAGKLKLAQAAALMNLFNTQLALRRAQTDLMAQVRGGYFAVLVARESMKWNRGLQQFTEQIYEVYLDNAILGNYAGYEPMQLRALTMQARATLSQARFRYLTAWKQLAATLGLPGLPLTELEGNVEAMAVPLFDREAALTRVLSTHTDVLTARNTLQRARYDLETAKVAPVPDVDVRVTVQKDYTTPPFTIAHNVQVGVPIPIWDQNRGNIRQAQGALLRATEEEHRVRAALSSSLADAFERYESNRRLVRDYHDRIIPDLSQVYTSTLNRFANQVANLGDTTTFASGAVAFADVITSQQLYVTAIATYAGALRDQWQAVVDLASLLQSDDLFQVPPVPPSPVPDVDHLPGMPCSHACNPLANGAACSPTVPSGQ
jgi:outer membrane protein, heavy metal efflux system